MKTLNITVAGAWNKPFRVTADGVPLPMRRNRHGNRTGSFQTENERVKVCIESIEELRSPLWLLAPLFFFLVSIFGIFDTRRTYDKRGAVWRAAFWVDTGSMPARDVRFIVQPFREGGAAMSTESDGVLVEENVAAVDPVLRRRANTVKAVKIVLWIALAVGIVAGALAALL